MSRPPDTGKRAAEQEAFLAAFAQTGLAKTAAAAAGMFPVKHYRWLKSDPAYARRFAELEQKTRDLALVSRKPRARGYKVTGSRVEERQRKQEAILAALMKTGIVQDAAREAGTTVASFHAWCRDDPEFLARAEAIRAEAEPRRQQILLERTRAGNRAAWTPERREAWGEHQRSSWTAEMRGAAAQRNLDRMADADYRRDWLASSRASREFAACDNPSYFDEIDTPDKAYWLGFIATDGCVRGFNSGSLRLVIKLARRDREHLVALHRTLRAKRPIRDTEERTRPPGSVEYKTRPCSTLDVCSPQIVNALVSHGITARKTNELEPWDGPPELMPHYWRGVVDGDGTIILSADDFKIGVCGSKALVEAFRAWAQSICGTAALPRQGTQGNRRYWTLYIGGMRQVPLILAALYDNAPAALARKKALADLAVHGKPLQAAIF